MGENGILKKKFLEFQRDLDMAQDDLKEMSDQKKELYDIISCCERDIRTLQKDMYDREDTIDEKDLRIYDLKRTNQVQYFQLQILLFYLELLLEGCNLSNQTAPCLCMTKLSSIL
jgi:chromosome segregation ATPase